MSVFEDFHVLFVFCSFWLSAHSKVHRHPNYVIIHIFSFTFSNQSSSNVTFGMPDPNHVHRPSSHTFARLEPHPQANEHHENAMTRRIRPPMSLQRSFRTKQNARSVFFVYSAAVTLSRFAASFGSCARSAKSR
jgi:hypothetical protein